MHMVNSACRCNCCRSGRYNLDPDVKFFATPPVHGSLAKFVDHPEDFCFALPEVRVGYGGRSLNLGKAAVKFLFQTPPPTTIFPKPFPMCQILVSSLCRRSAMRRGQ